MLPNHTIIPFHHLLNYSIVQFKGSLSFIYTFEINYRIPGLALPFNYTIFNYIVLNYIIVPTLMSTANQLNPPERVILKMLQILTLVTKLLYYRPITT